MLYARCETVGKPVVTVRARLLALGTIGAWRCRCRAMRRTAGWRPAGAAGAGGGSRCHGRKHPAPSTPPPCSREAHGTGTGTRDGETGTPGRLARLAPGGTSTAASTAASRGTQQGTPKAPHKVPRRSCPYPASPAGCDWPVRRSRACRCDAVPGRCGGAVRRALAGPVRRGASRGAAAVPGAVQDGGAAAGGVQRLAGVRRVRCDARPGVRLAGATRGAVRRCDRPPGAGATGGARRRPTRLGSFGFWLTAAKAMSPRPPPIDLSPNQKKNTVGYALCRREWSSAPARGHVCGLGGDPHLVGGRGLSGVDCSQASCECEDDCEEVCGVGHAEA